MIQVEIFENLKIFHENIAKYKVSLDLREFIPVFFKSKGFLIKDQKIRKSLTVGQFRILKRK